MKQKLSTIGLLLALLFMGIEAVSAAALVGPLARYRYVLRNTKTDNPDMKNRVENYVHEFFKDKGVRRVEGASIPKKERPLFIDIELFKKEDGHTHFSLSFYDKDEERLYYKFEKLEKSELKKLTEFEFLGKELETFIRIFSREGVVTGIDEKRVSIKFDRDLMEENLIGKAFEMFCVEDSCRSIDDAEIVGVITEVKGREVLGHFTRYPSEIKLYDMDISGLRIHVGNQKQYQDTLGEKEVIISEKNLEFNPQFLKSFKACAVLPFTGSFDNLEGARKLFKEKMANDARCIIKDDEKFYEIFDKYQGNLASYLQNRDVIKAVADKVESGSIFRVNIDKALGGLRISMDVVSENGSDIFFKERAVIDSGDYKSVVEIIFQWMIRYVRTFPYDARVIESVEGDILFDLGIKSIHNNNQLFEVYRPSKLKITSSGYVHKTEWEQKLVARGIVDRVQKEESVGRLLETDFENRQIRRGDWVKLVGADAFKKIKPVFAKHNLKTNRRTGRFKLGADMLLLNATISGNKVDEQFFSLSLGLDYYLPYGFIFSLDSERNSSDILSFDLNKNTVRAAIGYAKIIEGNLFVSLLDLFVGYTNNFIELSSLNVVFLGDLNLTGPYVSARAEVPLYEKSNLHFGLFAAPALSVDHKNTVLGGADDGSYYAGFVDLDYKLNESWTLFGEIKVERNSFTTEIQSVDIGINTTKFRIGTFFNF